MVSKRGGRQAVPFLGGEMAMRGVESQAPFGARLKLRVTQEKHVDVGRKWVSGGSQLALMGAQKPDQFGGTLGGPQIGEN